MRLKGKVALVTGGTRGIGRAIVETFAKEGASVVITSRNIDKARKFTDELEKRGLEALPLQVDVRSEMEVNKMVTSTLDKFGRINILVNNAGILEIVPIKDMTEEQWDRVMDVNLKGTFLCSKAVITSMMKQRSGKIVNIASDAGKTGAFLPASHYAASKAGVICFTKSLARELAPYVNVNAVSPGIIETEMSKQVVKQRKVTIPLKRLGKPQDVANAVLFLVSDEANYITGEIIDVNAGLVMD